LHLLLCLVLMIESTRCSAGGWAARRADASFHRRPMSTHTWYSIVIVPCAHTRLVLDMSVQLSYAILLYSLLLNMSDGSTDAHVRCLLWGRLLGFLQCNGTWLVAGQCNGACEGGFGFIPEYFNVTQPAMYGGPGCSSNGSAVVNGSLRYQVPCQNNATCPPVDCVGAWAFGACVGGCGGVRNGGTRSSETFRP